jgi:hypothetical protein
MTTKTARKARRALPLASGGVRGIAKLSHRAGRARGRREAREGTSLKLMGFMAGAGAGVAAEYLLDPQHGKRRRHVLRDWTAARLRRGAREAGRQKRYMAGKVMGVAADATPPGRDSSELNDPALAAKVESELFRPPDSPKGSVDVNVEDGVVFLRGEVTSRKQVEDLVERAQAVDGVVRAESLLHLPGEPAPHGA